MSRAVVRPSNQPDAPVTYEGGSGANYDEHGFLTIVTGEGDSARAVAVWAPGTWQRADLEDAETGEDAPE